MLYPYVTQTSSRSICLFIYLNICVHKYFQYAGELSFSVFYSYFFYKHTLFLSLIHFTGIFPFCSLMRSRHFGFGRLRWIYAIYNFSHYPLSSRASHRHRRQTGYKLIGCALSDWDIDHNSNVLNAFYLFIMHIHFVCLKHITSRDICFFVVATNGNSFLLVVQPIIFTTNFFSRFSTSSAKLNFPQNWHF